MSRARLARLEGHAIICGYGPIGENLNNTLAQTGIPTLVVELNVQTVERLRAEQQLCLFADAAQSETLRLAHLETARVLAITLPDYGTVQSAVANARQIKPGIFIVARAHFQAHAEKLRQIGVDAVIHQESEASYEIIRRVLTHCERPEAEIAESLRRARYESGG